MRDQPRGFTLIEMLASIGCTATLLMLCAITLNTLFQAERGARRDWSETAALERLGNLFRDDAHAAVKPIEAASTTQWTMTIGERSTIRYKIEGDTVIVEREANGPVNARADTFSFQRWRPVRFERVEGPGRPIARLVFRSAERAGAIEFPIEAVEGGLQ